MTHARIHPFLVSISMFWCACNTTSTYGIAPLYQEVSACPGQSLPTHLFPTSGSCCLIFPFICAFLSQKWKSSAFCIWYNVFLTVTQDKVTEILAGLVKTSPSRMQWAGGKQGPWPWSSAARCQDSSENSRVQGVLFRVICWPGTVSPSSGHLLLVHTVSGVVRTFEYTVWGAWSRRRNPVSEVAICCFP